MLSGSERIRGCWAVRSVRWRSTGRKRETWRAAIRTHTRRRRAPIRQRAASRSPAHARPRAPTAIRNETRSCRRTRLPHRWIDTSPSRCSAPQGSPTFCRRSIAARFSGRLSFLSLLSFCTIIRLGCAPRSREPDTKTCKPVNANASTIRRNNVKSAVSLAIFPLINPAVLVVVSVPDTSSVAAIADAIGRETRKLVEVALTVASTATLPAT
jgi:hypothetical protein